jgi:hypothetical protein
MWNAVKKLLVLFCLAGLVTVSACGGGSKTNAQSSSPKPAQTTAKPAPTADPKQEVSAVISQFAGAVVAGDTAKACSLTAVRFSFKRGKYEDKCPKLLAALDATAKRNFAVKSIGTFSYATPDPATAKFVLVTVTSPQGAQYKYSVVKSGSQWRVRDINF